MTTNTNEEVKQETTETPGQAAAPVENTGGGQPAFQIPEKFMKDGKPDFEAMAKSYVELEKKLGAGTKKDDGQKPGSGEGTQKDEGATNKEEQTIEVAKAAGVDVETLEAHFAEHGELSPQHYEDLEKRGFSKEVVDTYIQGQIALQEKLVNDVLTETVGSKAEFDKISKWAQASLADSELTVINKRLAAGPQDAKLALLYLKDMYTRANGTGKKLFEGISTTTAVAYDSREQAMRDIASKEYKSDPAFRAQVAARMAKSKF